MSMLLSIYRSLKVAIREINRKYETPSIQITPLVKFSLLFLRLYLFLLVGLLIYRFVGALK